LDSRQRCQFIITVGYIIERGVAFATGILTFHSSGPTITLTTTDESKGTFGSGTNELGTGLLASRSLTLDGAQTIAFALQVHGANNLLVPSAAGAQSLTTAQQTQALSNIGALRSDAVRPTVESHRNDQYNCRDDGPGLDVPHHTDYSTRLLVRILGTITNSAGAINQTTQLRYGTGTAPTNGAATAGTAAGRPCVLTINTATFNDTFDCDAIVTGLTRAPPTGWMSAW
jgi:hypothetical protein